MVGHRYDFITKDNRYREESMRKLAKHKPLYLPLLAGLVVGLLAMLLTVGLAAAAPPSQEGDPTPQPGMDVEQCQTCHLDISNSWQHSTHAHAYDDPFFQERWNALGQEGNCLLCHTTNYQATSGEFSAEGVSCEACHGKVDPNHPEVPAPIRDDAAYCGTCHTTTLGEWRLTGHASAEVGCTDCHDAHSQQAKFADPDEMCVNCHKDSMGPYLEDIHISRGIGCVDCHALVIPPEEPPEDGIVPTGHSFTITPATCVACHTDSLHAGFSLPGYERGAKDTDKSQASEGEKAKPEIVSYIQTPEERIQALENQAQTLQAALASRNMTILFQGGIVGLVLGSSTAWIVAHNVRRARQEKHEENGDEQ